jgi:hypothetical protein
VIDVVSCVVPPDDVRVTVVGLRDTAVAATSLLVTVTKQLALRVPTVTVMVDVPTPTAVTAPL